MYEKLQRYYELGLWDEVRLKNAVKRGVITPAEYQQITGKVYEML